MYFHILAVSTLSEIINSGLEIIFSVFSYLVLNFIPHRERLVLEELVHKKIFHCLLFHELTMTLAVFIQINLGFIYLCRILSLFLTIYLSFF